MDNIHLHYIIAYSMSHIETFICKILILFKIAFQKNLHNPNKNIDKNKIPSLVISQVVS